MVDARVSNTLSARSVGSSPTTRTRTSKAPPRPSTRQCRSDANPPGKERSCGCDDAQGHLWLEDGQRAAAHEVICITFAFFFGLAVRQIGLPPLVGFLAAGFAINAFGPGLGLPEETGEILKYVSHLGVLLLLFAVGLKLRLGQITQPQVLGGSLIHFALSTAVVTLGLALFMRLDWNTSLLLAMALSFSSTVFSAKILEAKRDIGAFYGRTAIGILIVQDIIALVVLAIWGGQRPSWRRRA